MKKSLILLSSLFVLFANTALSKTLEAVLSHTKNMHAYFTQTIHDEDGELLQQNSGRMALAKPGQFYWETLSPTPQLMILNDNLLWIYDKPLQQATKRHVDSEISQSPAVLLTQDVSSIGKIFKIEPIQRANDKQSFKLTPLKQDMSYTEIELDFNKKDQLNGLRFKDNLGQHITVLLTGVKTNSRFNKDLFIFKPPRGTDVVDQDTQN